MKTTTERMLQGLEKAIQAEVDGYHFYMMASKSTEDPQGREIFERMAQDEVKHARFLQEQYDSMKTTGKPDPAITLGAATEFKGEHPIFSKALQERVKNAHLEMSALSIGVQLELSAVKFYRSEADDAADPVVASFYRELADWESGHYHALLAQQNALRSDYWSDGRFSPF